MLIRLPEKGRWPESRKPFALPRQTNANLRAVGDKEYATQPRKTRVGRPGTSNPDRVEYAPRRDGQLSDGPTIAARESRS